MGTLLPENAIFMAVESVLTFITEKSVLGKQPKKVTKTGKTQKAGGRGKGDGGGVCACV